MDTFQHFLASSERWGKALRRIISLFTCGKCEYCLSVWYQRQVLGWPEDSVVLNALPTVQELRRCHGVTYLTAPRTVVAILAGSATRLDTSAASHRAAFPR